MKAEASQELSDPFNGIDPVTKGAAGTLLDPFIDGFFTRGGLLKICRTVESKRRGRLPLEDTTFRVNKQG